MIRLFVLLALPAAASPAPPDPCKPPYASITTCPDNYLPFPIQVPPSVADKDAITILIKAAQAAEAVEVKVRTDWVAAGVKYRANVDKNSTYAAKDLQDYDNLAGKLRQAKLATQTAYDAAISRTASVYRLTPPIADFSQDPSLGEPWRAMQPWLPRYSTEEIPDPKTGQMRRRRPEELASEEAANRAAAIALGTSGWRMPAGASTDVRTGRMRIFGTAVLDANGKVNPDQFAALILHETTHWVDAVSKAGKFHTPADKYQLEARAYASMAKLNAALGNAAEATAQSATAAQYLAQQLESSRNNLTFDQIKADPNYRRWLRVADTADVQGSNPNPGDPEPTKAGGEETFLDDLDRMGETSTRSRKIARAIIDRDQKEREDWQRRDHAAFMARIAARDAAVRAAYQYLKTAAGLACANPDQFLRESQGGAVISAGVDQLDFSNFLSSDINEVGWKSIGIKPNDCQEEVMRKMIYSPGPVGPAAVAAWASAYRNAHPGILKRFVMSVNDLFESKGSYEEVSRRAEAPSEPTRHPEPENRPAESPRQVDPPAHSGRSGSSDDYAKRQLRGIDITKKW